VVPQYSPMHPTLVREPFHRPGWKLTMAERCRIRSMASVDDVRVRLRRAERLLIESGHRLAVSSDRIGASLLRVTRRRRIAGGDGENDNASACKVCGQRVDGGAWTKINGAVYHNRCWDRRAKNSAGTQSKPTRRQ